MRSTLFYKGNSYMKVFKYLFFLIVLISIDTGFVSAQYPVKVNVQVRQPVSPYLPQLLGELQQRQVGAMTRDITDRLHITLHNSGNRPKNVKLSGKIERLSPTPMSISLRPGFAPPNPVNMNPGQMIQADRDLLNQAFGGFSRNDLIFNNTGLSELRQNTMNYKLPEGMYRICISAFDYNKVGMTGPLSAPGTGCATFMICYSASAPQLIMPVSTMGFNDKNNFQPFTPRSSQVQFTWTAPASTCGLPIGAVTYDLSIRQVFPGQAIKDALFNPPVFQKENIHTTTFLLDTIRYPHVLRSDQNYIFRVKANFISTPGSPLELDNRGYSQIGAFAFNPAEAPSNVDAAGEIIASNEDTLPKVETIVKGTLTYRFANHSTDSVFPLANQKVYIKRVYVKTSKDADGIVHFNPLSEAEQNSMPVHPKMVDGQLTETDENGHFQLRVGMTQMDNAGLLTGEEWQNLFAVQYDGNDQILPENAHPNIPDQLKDLEGKMVRLYKIEIANPLFKSSEKYVQISPGEERNLRNVVVEANSYALKVNVQEVVEAQSEALFTRGVEQMQGDFVEGATVKLYRLTKNKMNPDLSIPYYEGDLIDKSAWQEEGDKVLIASRTTPILNTETDNAEDYTVVFPRLFKSAAGELYDYIICLENGKGTMRLPVNKGVVNDPPVPRSSGVWGTIDNLEHGDPTIMEFGNQPPPAMDFNESQPLPGGNNPLQNGNQPLPDAKPHVQPESTQPVPGHGPYAGNLFPYLLPAEKELPVSAALAPDAEDAITNKIMDYGDKWRSWNYNGPSDVAYLTLEKELAEPPHTVVTGKLEYKFKGDPSIPAQPYANMPVKLMMFYIKKDGTQPDASNPANSTYYSTMVQTYANQDFPEGTKVDVPTDQHAHGGGRTVFDDNGKVVQTTITDAEGNFIFDFENLDSSKVVFGTLVTDGGYDRGRKVTYRRYGEFVRVYRVVPAVNQYTAPDDNIPAQPWADYDCGTLTSFVRTFNLEVAVQAEETLLQQNDIPVQLYFNPDANPEYPIPAKPGVDLNTRREVNGENYILIRKGMASEKKEETFQNAIDEGALAAIESGIGYKASTIPDRTYQFKTITFKDLVISQSAADYGRFYYIEAGGTPMERKGNITLESDYLAYPKNQISDNWDSDFYNYRSRNGMDDQLTAITRALEKRIIFNSEYDPNRTIRVYLAPDLAEPRIAGRLIDDFTTLGVSTGWGSVKLIAKRYKYGSSTHYLADGTKEITVSENPVEEMITYNVAANDYGYFDFKAFSEEFKDKHLVAIAPVELRISAWGYNDTVIQLPQAMHQGEQIYMDPIVLKPACAGCYGFVVDEDNPEQGVAARVKVLKNGRWVDTYPYKNGGLVNSANISLLGSGILHNTVMHAAMDADMGNPGYIDGFFRPILGRPMQQAGMTGNVGMSNMVNSLKGAASGPNGFLYSRPSPPGKSLWKTFGGLQVRTNRRGEVKEAKIVEGAKNAGMWKRYVEAVSGENSQPQIVGKEPATDMQIASSASYKQRFDLPMPSKSHEVKIVILPYDRSYIPDTVEVNSYDSENLGTFALKRRKHKIKVKLHMKSDPNEVPVGAIVSIEGVEGEKVVKGDGTAYFEFVNNSTSNFTLRVRPQQPESVSEGLDAQFDIPNFTFTDQAEGEFNTHSNSSGVVVPNTIFVPKTVNFSNEDNNVEHIVEVELEEGGSLSGKVTFEKDGTPVKNAVVYLDRGQGLQTDVITTTDEEGRYILAGIPIPNQTSGYAIQMGASYSDKLHSYIGEVKDVNLAETLTENKVSVNFHIKEVKDIDLTHLLGMPVRLTAAEKEGENGYKVSGEFFDLPENDNFSIDRTSSGMSLSFDEISVVASEITNESGIPLAVPTGDSILLDNRELSVKAFEVYNAKVTAKLVNGRLRVEKVDSDTSGLLNGAVRIVDNSFNFPSSYMTISNTDFYLGNFGTQENQPVDNQEGETIQSNNQQNDDQQSNLQGHGQQTMVIQDTSPQALVIQGVAGSKTVTEGLMPALRYDDKLIIPVFSSQDYPLTKFSLTNSQGNGIEFNYLGFDGTTGNSGSRESYITADSVNLYLNLTARIQGGIELHFNAGKAVLTHNSMKGVSNDDTLRMKLEEWELMSTSWELSPTSGGIILKEGVLNTGIVGLPFSNMSIIPGDPEGELICNSLDAASLKEAADEGKLVLGGGAAELKLYDNIDIVFAYDPDVGTTPGEGHYKFSLHSRLGKVACFGGLDGMTDPSQRLDVQFVSSLSNGEQLFAFDGQMEPIILYNQLYFTPQRLFNYEDNFSIGGLMQMHVPDMPKNIGLNLRYDYTGEEDIRNELTISPIDFHFTGNGSSKFKVDMGYEDLQRIDKDVVAFPGIVTLPNSSQTFNANFVSIVYEGAKDLIPATGKVDLAHNDRFSSGNYYARSGGVQSAEDAGDTRHLQSYRNGILALPAEEEPEMKTHTEIFVGTSDQLFGDAAKALTGSLSSMNNYGGGTGGTMNDFSNEIYNSASGMVNDLNTRGRQTYNNLLKQVGSLRTEAYQAYERVASQIGELGANGLEAYDEAEGEILTALDSLKIYSDELYNEVLSKKSEFLNYGSSVYHEISDGLTGQAEGGQRQAQEMYDDLTVEITDQMSEFQVRSAGVYSTVMHKATALRTMGDETYDQLYNELSGTFSHLKNKGNEVSRDVVGIIDDYEDYGTQVLADASGGIEEVVNTGTEALDQMLSEVDELRQQTEDSYNQVSAQIEDLRAQGKEEYAAAQEEILAHLEELRTQGDALYNALQTRKEEWLQQGQDILNDATGQITDLEAYGKGMYDSLYSDITGRAEELEAYATDLYDGITGPINDLRSKGQDMYDEVYGEISGTIDEYKNYGQGVYDEVDGVISAYQSYGADLYNDIYGSVSDKVDEIRSYGEGVADDVISYGKGMLDEAMAGPIGDVIDEMNGVRNTAEQYISMGDQKVDSILAKWPIAGDAIDAFKDFDGNDIEGSLLRMAGNMVGFDGIKENAEDKLILVANETIEGMKESLEIDNISSSVSDVASNDAFKGMNIDIDLNTGRITGSMYSDFVGFGAVELYQLGIEVFIDRNGWYLYSGAGVNMPAATPLNPIIFPIGVGFLVGVYPTISPSLESRVTQHSYVHRLPEPIMADGISGFFLTGKKDILRPTSVGINFAIVDFEIGASAGMDARLYANFGDDATSIGLGVMAFADAYARLSVLGTCGISGSAAANVGIKASYVNSAAGSSLSAAACASVAVAGSAWCGWGDAKISGSFNESIMAMLQLCAGSACSEAVTMDLEMGSTCATSNKFDY